MSSLPLLDLRRASGHAPLQALVPQELVELVPGVDISEARKLLSLVHRHGALPQHAPAGVRRGSFELVRAATYLPALVTLARMPSSVDPFVKYTMTARAENPFPGAPNETNAFAPKSGAVEAVRIPLEHPGRMSVCVSSQVGCALACAFCATGRMGLLRNLEDWEIVEQVRIVRADLPAGARVHGVVFQGMGEPLANLRQVARAARVFSEPAALAIDARNITVCTAGLPSGIRALAEVLPRARLALSIGSARAGRRRALMPIDAVHSLEDAVAAAGDHASATGLSPLFAYALLAGHNDSEEDASALADLVLRFAERYVRRPRLSLLAYNSIGDNDPFVRTAPDVEEHFRQTLIARGVTPGRRYSGGWDVGAACGQLATHVGA
jgi:23S rRNA (adenine2503-C2)-methyltransferase